MNLTIIANTRPNLMEIPPNYDEEKRGFYSLRIVSCL
jgi:hypothetical protein